MKNRATTSTTSTTPIASFNDTTAFTYSSSQVMLSSSTTEPSSIATDLVTKALTTTAPTVQPTLVPSTTTQSSTVTTSTTTVSLSTSYSSTTTSSTTTRSTPVYTSTTTTMLPTSWTTTSFRTTYMPRGTSATSSTTRRVFTTVVKTSPATLLPSTTTTTTQIPYQTPEPARQSPDFEPWLDAMGVLLYQFAFGFPNKDNQTDDNFHNETSMDNDGVVPDIGKKTGGALTIAWIWQEFLGKKSLNIYFLVFHIYFFAIKKYKKSIKSRTY